MFGFSLQINLSLLLRSHELDIVIMERILDSSASAVLVGIGTLYLRERVLGFAPAY